MKLTRWKETHTHSQINFVNWTSSLSLSAVFFEISNLSLCRVQNFPKMEREQHSAVDFSGICYVWLEYDTSLLLSYFCCKSQMSHWNIDDSNVNVVSHTSKRSFYEFLRVFYSPSFCHSLLTYVDSCNFNLSPANDSIYALLRILCKILTHFVAVILITNIFRFNFLALLPMREWVEACLTDFQLAAMWLMLIRWKWQKTK